jgi:pimeloyl-ACP methyl ester carboxylesterase
MREQRLFIPLKDREAHVRILGSGPPVVLVHGSPQSSRALVPLMQAVAAAGGTAIAPDTPGNGWSTPFANPHGAQTFAHALAKVMGALGLGPVPVYGFHSGAVFAAELALSAPDKVGALLLDGVPCFTAKDQTDFHHNYFKWFEPALDGSHMAWAWSRIEDQSWFFPWYRHSPKTWMAHGVASTERIHANVMDYLVSPNSSTPPYAAALSWRVLPLARLEASRPVWVTAAPDDPLAGHLERLPPLAGARVDLAPQEPGERLAVFARWLVDQARARSVRGLKIPEGIQKGQLRCVPGPYGPVVIRVPSPLLTPQPATARLVPWGRSVWHWAPKAPTDVLVERPGHGASAPVPEGTAPLEDAVYAAAVLGAAGFGHLPVAGTGEPCPPLPDLTPEWDGTHLLRAWRLARRLSLFQDWTAPAHATRHKSGTATGLDALQDHAVDLLLAARALKAARPPAAP